MRFTATADDFLRGKIVTVGWHPVVVSAYTEKMSKGDVEKGKEPSQYAEIQFRIVDGPDKGVILYTNFSEKAPGFIIPFVEALGAKVDKTKGFSGELSETLVKGKTLDVHVIRGSWNGKPKNEIEGYRPFTGKVVTQNTPGV